MLTPMKNLGANLLFVFSVGGLWAVGYLVSPYLADILPASDITALRKSMMALAVLGFVVSLLTRLKAVNWRPWQDPGCLIGALALLTGIVFLLVPAAAQEASAALYAFCSLLCVAWAGWSPVPQADQDN